ncbi:MAG: hypothetical protein A2Y24_02855 [Clostridiales bacterium GWE2_32_10]|nr:MAG: hypothetical protein A2Y24_02855 [Clostridiales bacterium GWE2_32_10]HBY19564.1 hypothetical protein [Clostridiales bacterium]
MKNSKKKFRKIVAYTMIISLMSSIINITTVNAASDTWEFEHTGDVQTFTAPKTATYSLETWGAQGGNAENTIAWARESDINPNSSHPNDLIKVERGDSIGGYGGYSYGEIELKKGETLKVYVGGKGKNSSDGGKGGWNGGGSAGGVNNITPDASGGGGATDIRYNYNRIIVAGGGGGVDASDDDIYYVSGIGWAFWSDYRAPQRGGDGGGLRSTVGNQGYKSTWLGMDHYDTTDIDYATQTKGYMLGTGGSGGSADCGLESETNYACGGGGGFFGGKAGDGHVSNSSGGSSYVGGVLNGSTIAGNQNFKSPDGSQRQGNIGNGYARIKTLACINLSQNIVEYNNKIDIEGDVITQTPDHYTLKYQLEDQNGNIKVGPGTIIDDLVSNGEQIQFEKKGVDISNSGLTEASYYLLKVYLEPKGSIKQTSIAAGINSMSIRNGAIYTWGNNAYEKRRYTPVKMFELDDVESISVNGKRVIALKEDGTVYTWNSLDGALFDIEKVESKLFTKAKSVVAGGSHYMLLKENGELLSWGDNSSGQLGDGTVTNRDTPVMVKNLTDVKSISVGEGHCIALKTDGTVWTWGHNWGGCLGIRVRDQWDNIDINYKALTPVKVPGLTNVKSIAAGNYQSMVLKEDGTVWTWGGGCLGNGTTNDSDIPVQVTGLTNIKSISLSSNTRSVMVLKEDGTVWVWGDTSYGLLGDGEKTNIIPISSVTSPVQVPNLTNVKSISMGSYHSLAMEEDGTVWQWGYKPTTTNLYSDVRLGITFFPSPHQVEFGTSTFQTVAFTKDDSIPPTISFEVPTNNNIMYQAPVNVIVEDEQSGIQKYRYKWICNPPESLLGEEIKNETLNSFMSDDWKIVTGYQNILTETITFRQSGPWYLFVQAVDNKANMTSKRLDKQIEIDTLAPKTPSIEVLIDNSGVMQVSWSKFQEYTQEELDKINSEEGYTYQTSIGTTVTIQSSGDNIEMMSSGFGEMRLYVQRWGKLGSSENYGWYNILKDGEHIKITNEDQVNQAVTDALTKEIINGNGVKYRVNIKHIDKAALDYITYYGIKDEWDEGVVPQKFKDTELITGEIVNINNIENIVESSWKETYVNLGTVKINEPIVVPQTITQGEIETKSLQNSLIIPLNWDRIAGRGRIVLSWQPVEGASGYYVEICDGNKWDRYDVSDATTWDSSAAKIYPTESSLNNFVDNTYEEEMFLHNTGLELKDNPIKVYLKTIGQMLDNQTAYYVRVRPYITTVIKASDGKIIEQTIEGPIGSESVKEIQLPNRTDLSSPTVATLIEYIENNTAAYITVTMVDTESRPKSIILYNNQGVELYSTSTNGQYMTNIYKVHANGTYTFTGIDNVGWYTVANVLVTDIGSTKPILLFKRLDDKGYERIISKITLPKIIENAHYTKYGVGTMDSIWATKDLISDIIVD